MSLCLLLPLFRLFTSVPADAFSGPTISALLALFDNYDENCKVTEVIPAEEQTENDAFLDAILATSVFQQAHEFLVSKGINLIHLKILDNILLVTKNTIRIGWCGYRRLQGVLASHLDGPIQSRWGNWRLFRTGTRLPGRKERKQHFRIPRMDQVLSRRIGRKDELPGLHDQNRFGRG